MSPEPPTVTHVGPTVVGCPMRCEVPMGVVLVEVPVPRLHLGDVIVCPDLSCGRALLVKQMGGQT